jgi:hypothetical protein
MTLVTLVEAGEAVGLSLRTMRRIVAGGYLTPAETTLARCRGGGVQLYLLSEVRDAASAYRRENPRGRPRKVS